MKKYSKNELVPDIIIDFDEWEKHSEIYSVIPKYFFFKKYFLEIGPLINFTIFSLFIILNAILTFFNVLI